MATAASLPLGSIKPYSKSISERTSPEVNPAEVPIIELALWETLTGDESGIQFF